MLYVFDLGNRMVHSFTYEAHGLGVGVSPVTFTVGSEHGLIRTVSAGNITGISGGYSGALVVGYGYQLSRSITRDHAALSRSDGSALGLSVSLGLQLSNTGFVGSDRIDDVRSADVRGAFEQAFDSFCGGGSR